METAEPVVTELRVELCFLCPSRAARRGEAIASWMGSTDLQWRAYRLLLLEIFQMAQRYSGWLKFPLKVGSVKRLRWNVKWWFIVLGSRYSQLLDIPVKMHFLGSLALIANHIPMILYFSDMNISVYFVVFIISFKLAYIVNRIFSI